MAQGGRAAQGGQEKGGEEGLGGILFLGVLFLRRLVPGRLGEQGRYLEGHGPKRFHYGDIFALHGREVKEGLGGGGDRVAIGGSLILVGL